MHIDYVIWAILVLGGASPLASLVLTTWATVCKHRRPIHDLPYLHLPEITVGENSLRIYSRGCELYTAMLATIAYAKESIYLESFIFKGDTVGQAFKKHEGVSQPHFRRYRASKRPSSRSLVRISSMVSGAVRAEVCLQTTPLCP